MTNREKFAEKILDVACSGSRLAVSKSTLEPTTCKGLECGDCLLYTRGLDDCRDKASGWANSEYVEPPIDWSKVAVDTPILVTNNGYKWIKRHFAKYENGDVYAWNDGTTSWSSDGHTSAWGLAKFPERNEHGTN